MCSTVLAPDINSAQGVFIEAFITATLCLAVLMLAAEKHIATPFAPVSLNRNMQGVTPSDCVFRLELV